MKTFKNWITLGLLAPWCVSAVLANPPADSNQASSYANSEMKCFTHEQKVCGANDLSKSSGKKQILIVPTGYQDADKADFEGRVQEYITAMTGVGSNVFSDKYKNQFVFVSIWIPGKDFASKEANFGAELIPHPIRQGFGIVLDEDKVDSALNELKRVHTRQLSPLTIITVFNTEEGATPNAKTPTFLDKSYGIVMMTKKDMANSYVPSHETAHGMLNFLDEYVEGGLENVSVKSFDALSSFAAFGEGWAGLKNFWENIRGLYPIRISDFLANNGSENITTDQFPSRVKTNGYNGREFKYEGGMFFGRGTYHHAGSNIMNSGTVIRGPGDEFDFDHSQSQLDVIEQVFEKPDTASRPNDRIKNNGPVDKLQFTFGGDTYLMLFDGDKNHRFHSTQRYDVQIGWYERDWKWCKAAFIPYPCYDKKWTVVEKSMKPQLHAIDLRETKLYGLAKFARFLGCDLGLAKIPKKSREEVKKICKYKVETLAESFLPSMSFVTPYEKVKVPVSQAFTKYFWRFRTDNGTMESGYTTWSDFSRAF